MITKLLNEINTGIEKLNYLLEDNQYLEDLEKRIEDINNRIDRTNKENERLNNIINELEEDTRCGYYEYSSSDGDYIEGYDDGASKTADFFNKMIKELRGNKVDKENI